MTRPTRVEINKEALLQNLNQVKQSAPGKKIIAMVKANAYGCGLAAVIPVLEGQVDAFGVACLEEALAIRALGAKTICTLFQGIFTADELAVVAANEFHCVIHQPYQLEWVLATPLEKKIKLWVKVDTGMHRLGFAPEEVYEVIEALRHCPWVDQELGLMTHLASADEPLKVCNQQQLQCYQELNLPPIRLVKSIANSAAILALPEAHADVVRPGIMLYGVSPFENRSAESLRLQPVMRFVSAISALHDYPAQTAIGYGGTWRSQRPSVIGIVAAGYGDGYPRHVAENTPVWLNGQLAPIVGRVSMDMLAVDLTDCSQVNIGDLVELWGPHVPVEKVAKAAGTSAYELLCQFAPRGDRIRFYNIG